MRTPTATTALSCLLGLAGSALLGGCHPQLWNFLPTGDGNDRVTPGTNTFSSLTTGPTVKQWTYAGAISQQWAVAPAN